MAQSIERLLHRRADLSTFLVHLTRDDTGRLGDDARTKFLSIATSQTIEARTPLGMAADLDEILVDSVGTQRVVCFTETPLEHVWMMTENIATRRLQFSQYGFVFTKTTARRKRCNPIWYLDITPGHHWLTVNVKALIDDAIKACPDKMTQADVEAFQQRDIFRLTPFIEQMGPMNNGGRKEFWWEREWRRPGHFHFNLHEIVALFAPADDHDDIRQDLAGHTPFWRDRPVPILDPIWGQERMIAEMSGVDQM